MRLELSELAALVSANYRPNRAIYKIPDDVQWKCRGRRVALEVVGHLPPADTAEPCTTLPDVQISNTSRLELFWRLQRIGDCHYAALALACAIRKVAEHGIELAHQQEPIDNVVVMNSSGVDVDDLWDGQVWIYDRPSGVVMPTLSTIEAAETWSAHPEAANRLRGVGRELLFKELYDSQETKPLGVRERHEPHYWLCARVASKKLVHVDICGPQFDTHTLQQAALLDVDGCEGWAGTQAEGPVHVFETDDYAFHHNREQPHKFYLTEEVCGKGVVRQVPKELRHFRLARVGLPVQATSIPEYINRRRVAGGGQGDVDAAAAASTALIQHVLLQAPSGTVVKAHGLQKSTELNGQKGQVQRAQGARLAVRFPNSSVWKLLRPDNVAVAKAGQRCQYLTTQEMKEASDLEAARGYLPKGRLVRIRGVYGSPTAALNGMTARVSGQYSISAGGVLVSVATDDGQVEAHVPFENLERLEVPASELGHDETDSLPTLPQPSKLMPVERLRRTLSGPDGIKLSRVLWQSQGSFTTVTDPVVYPTFRVLVRHRFFSRVVKNYNLQRNYEVFVCVMEAPKGERVRDLVLQLKSGGSVEDMRMACQDKDVARMIRWLERIGALRMRA